MIDSIDNSMAAPIRDAEGSRGRFPGDGRAVRKPQFKLNLFLPFWVRTEVLLRIGTPGLMS